MCRRTIPLSNSVHYFLIRPIFFEPGDFILGNLIGTQNLIQDVFYEEKNPASGEDLRFHPLQILGFWTCFPYQGP